MFLLLLIIISVNLFIRNSQKDAEISHKDVYINKIFEYQKKIDYYKNEGDKKLNICNEEAKNGKIDEDCKNWLDSVIYYSNH